MRHIQLMGVLSVLSFTFVSAFGLQNSVEKRAVSTTGFVASGDGPGNGGGLAAMDLKRIFEKGHELARLVVKEVSIEHLPEKASEEVKNWVKDNLPNLGTVSEKATYEWTEKPQKRCAETTIKTDPKNPNSVVPSHITFNQEKCIQEGVITVDRSSHTFIHEWIHQCKVESDQHPLIEAITESLVLGWELNILKQGKSQADSLPLYSTLAELMESLSDKDSIEDLAKKLGHRTAGEMTIFFARAMKEYYEKNALPVHQVTGNTYVGELLKGLESQNPSERFVALVTIYRDLNKNEKPIRIPAHPIVQAFLRDKGILDTDFRYFTLVFKLIGSEAWTELGNVLITGRDVREKVFSVIRDAYLTGENIRASIPGLVKALQVETDLNQFAIETGLIVERMGDQIAPYLAELQEIARRKTPMGAFIAQSVANIKASIDDVDGLLRDLDDADPNVRASALGGIKRLRTPDDRVRSRVVDALNSNDAIGVLAQSTLARLMSPQELADLMKTNPSPRVRWGVGGAIESQGRRAAVVIPDLQAIYRDAVETNNFTTQHAVERALEAMKTEESRAALEQLPKDRERIYQEKFKRMKERIQAEAPAILSRRKQLRAWVCANSTMPSGAHPNSNGYWDNDLGIRWWKQPRDLNEYQEMMEDYNDLNHWGAGGQTPPVPIPPPQGATFSNEPSDYRFDRESMFRWDNNVGKAKFKVPQNFREWNNMKHAKYLLELHGTIPAGRVPWPERLKY